MLEKILKEIEERINYYRDNAAAEYVDVCAGLREAEGIIRKCSAAEKITDNGWIPVEERLPESNAVNPITLDALVYPVTVDLGGVTDIRYYSFWRGHWYNQGPKTMDHLVLAWQPLPEPYRKE